MDDLISRQAALGALEKIDCSDGVGISSLKCDAVEDAVIAIKALPPAQPTDEDIQMMQDIEQAMLDKAYECGKQDAQRWIPCEERLPEPGVNVLVDVLDIPAGTASRLWIKSGMMGTGATVTANGWLLRGCRFLTRGKGKTMDDTISRAAVLEIIRGYCPDGPKSKDLREYWKRGLNRSLRCGKKLRKSRLRIGGFRARSGCLKTIQTFLCGLNITDMGITTVCIRCTESGTICRNTIRG